MEEDCGMYDALNKAVAWGRGDILGHLNADEQYLPGILERVRGSLTCIREWISCAEIWYSRMPLGDRYPTVAQSYRQ